MKRWILIALLTGIATSGLWADETVSLEKYAALVLEHNRDIRKAEKAVEDAAEALGVKTSLESTRISIGANAGYGPPPGPVPAPNELTWSGDASVSVPIIPQVSLGGRINTERTGSVSLTLSPFATGLKSPAQQESYEKAVLALGYTRSQVAQNAEKAGFGLILRQSEKEQAEKELEYQQQLYEVARERYEIGDATYSELQDALNALSESRRSSYDAEKRLLSARQDVQLLLGPDAETTEVEQVTLETLQQMIDHRREQADTAASSSEPTSQTLEQLSMELTRLQEDLKQTWLWRPNLGVSVSAAVPLEDVQATVSLSFSPGDLKIDERTDLKEAIEDKLDEISVERFRLKVEKELLEKTVSMAEEALGIVRLDLEQSRLSLKEAEELHRQGYLTELELKQSRLQLSSVENRVFSSAYDLYVALGNLLSLYGASWV